MQPFHRNDPTKRTSQLWNKQIAEEELSNVVDTITCPGCGSDEEKFYLGSINVNSYYRCDECKRTIILGHFDPRSPVRYHEGVQLETMLPQSESESFARLLPVLRAGLPES